MRSMLGSGSGLYFPLPWSTSYPAMPSGMVTEDAERLLAMGLMIPEPRRTSLLSSGVGRDWPDARGVFDWIDGLAAWINNEEHLTVVSARKDGDLKAALMRLHDVERGIVTALEGEGLRFAHSARLGFLTSSLDRLGTGLSVSVELQLPKLAARADLADLCAAQGLVLASTHRGVVEVQSRSSFGVTVAGQIGSLGDGCKTLLSMED